MIDLTAWWDRFAAALQHPAFHAAFLALLVGIALTETLAQLGPQSMDRRTAEKLMRVTVALLVTFGGYYLHPTTIGAGWALFAGLSAPSIHHHLQSWAYARWPALKPKALQ